MRQSDHAGLRGNKLLKGQCPSFRPQLEALESRTVPAPLIHRAHPLTPAETNSAAIAPPSRQQGSSATSGALSGLQPIGSQQAGAGVNEMQVTVKENSPATVIDLESVFAGMTGIQQEELQMSLLGNTNAGLVKTDLSDGELTLTYTPSQFGTATVMVGATEADGASVQENILVTVLPATGANGNTGGTSSVLTGLPTTTCRSVPMLLNTIT
jgi:hypothetical protein